MTATDLPPRQLIELALEAIGDSAPERLRPLLSPGIRIVTERGSNDGVEAALAWAAKRYDHLDRRYRIEELEPVGEALLGSGTVDYVWRESGEVGDSTPVFLGIRLEDSLLAGLSIHDDESSARAALS